MYINSINITNTSAKTDDEDPIPIKEQPVNKKDFLTIPFIFWSLIRCSRK